MVVHAGARTVDDKKEQVMRIRIRRVGLAAMLLVACASALILSRSPAWADSTGCDVVEVAVWTRVGARIHVLCTQTVLGDVKFFAISASDPDASRIESLATSALVAKRQLNIMYDPDPANNPPGCAADNCRLLEAALLR
jgi:hypothetical protein